MGRYTVLKFGGTSVGTPEALDISLKETLRIHDERLQKDPNATTVVDFSATGRQRGRAIKAKNTDVLEKILAGEHVDSYISELWEREEIARSHLRLPEGFNQPFFARLDSALTEQQEQVRYADVVTSVGERLKAAQMASALNVIRSGIAIHVDYDKSGVVTSGGHRFAQRTERTYLSIQNALSLPEYAGKLLVLGGFMGIDESSGKVTTLFRGGGDTHAVWLGATPGILTAIDQTITLLGLPLDTISYSYRGRCMPLSTQNTDGARVIQELHSRLFPRNV